VQRRHAELTRRVDRASEQADLAARAVATAPALLGADRPRRFLLAVYTPVESRGGGGFMGNFGELTADHGRVTLSRFGRIRELEQGGPDPAGRTITGHREYLANWGRFKPAQYWGIVNLTNDFPTAADVMRQLYPQSGGTDVDGVIAIDPDGVAAFLRVTGPISVPGVDLTLTPENAREVLLHDQYLLPEASRVDYLGDASRALFERLTTGELPGIAALAKEVAPAVAGRHLQLWSRRDDEQALFARIGGTGAVPSVRGDSVGVIGQNFNGNKIDWFLQRRLTYNAKWDPGTGEVRSTLDVTLENRAPSSGEPHSVIGWGGDEILGQAPVQDGENLMLLTIYSALPPTRVTVDGSSVEMNRSKELGRTTSRFYVRVPAGATRAVHAEFHGAIEQGSTYRFDPMIQPLANADTMQVSVHVGDRWELARDASATWTLDRPHRLDVTACPVRPIPLLELRTNC
jgi:hypothetical protein